MKIYVSLISSLSVGRFESEMREYPEIINVRQIVEDLGILEKDVGVVLINKKHASFEDSLNEGDTLLLLPLLDGG